MNIAPFELVLARAPRSIALQAQPQLEQFGSSRAYYLKWQSWLESLMRTTDKSLRKEQAKYKRNFDARLRKPKYDIHVGSYVFLRKEQGTATEPKHKLAKVATGPYAVKQSDRNTVVIVIGDQEERVSRDRVELAPSPTDYAPVTGLRQALQFLSRTNDDEEGSTAGDEGRPNMHATTAGGNNELINSSEVEGVARGSQELGNSEAQGGQKDLQEGEGNEPVPEETSENKEYVINKVIDHAYKGEKLFLKVEWYGYAVEEATWEPIEQLSRSAAVTYFRRKALYLPAQVAQAKPG